MQTNSAIEDIVIRELKALCGTCVYRAECVYHKTSSKAIIQCELFDMDTEETAYKQTTRNGLCTTCDHANRCTLPGRRHGVWHCSEFR